MQCFLIWYGLLSFIRQSSAKIFCFISSAIIFLCQVSIIASYLNKTASEFLYNHRANVFSHSGVETKITRFSVESCHAAPATNISIETRGHEWVRQIFFTRKTFDETFIILEIVLHFIIIWSLTWMPSQTILLVFLLCFVKHFEIFNWNIRIWGDHHLWLFCIKHIR